VKRWTPFALGMVAVAVTTATVLAEVSDGRSVRPVARTEEPSPAARFDPEQSAALFIGIRKFTRDEVGEVPYAVDDAVDLAYAFVFDPRARLLPPRRVVLALSGSPTKDESKAHIEELKDANVCVVNRADVDTILELLERQKEIAGRDGIFILSIATHGFIHDDISYVLGSSSTFRDPGTALSSARLFELAGSSAARRSLVFVDACRDRMETGTRAGAPDARTAAPILRRMPRVEGQVIFYAAAPGQYAYDDPESCNGVFTRRVIAGLSCNATATRGVVTVENLHTYVEREVLRWIRENRDSDATVATQLTTDGRAHLMPLSSCSPDPLPGMPARVSRNGSRVTIFDLHGVKLWDHDLDVEILHAELTHLDDDVDKEVVAGTRAQLVALDADGKSLWSDGDGMALRAFAVTDRFRDRPSRIVALWTDEREPISRLSILGTDGGTIAIYEHRGRLEHLLVDRPDRRFKPRVIVAGAQDVLLFDPAKPEKPEWHRTIPSTESIERVAVVAHDHGRERVVAVTIANGKTFLFALATGAARTGL
jgi:hypothetical protein